MEQIKNFCQRLLDSGRWAIGLSSLDEKIGKKRREEETEGDIPAKKPRVHGPQSFPVFDVPAEAGNVAICINSATEQIAQNCTQLLQVESSGCDSSTPQLSGHFGAASNADAKAIGNTAVQQHIRKLNGKSASTDDDILRCEIVTIDCDEEDEVGSQQSTIASATCSSAGAASGGASNAEHCLSTLKEGEQRSEEEEESESDVEPLPMAGTAARFTASLGASVAADEVAWCTLTTLEGVRTFVHAARLTLGRPTVPIAASESGSDSFLAIHCPFVSARHCTLVRTDAGAMLLDWSRNGTWVNEIQVPRTSDDAALYAHATPRLETAATGPGVALRNGDRIELCRSAEVAAHRTFVVRFPGTL